MANKTDIVNAVAHKAGITKKQAGEAVGAVIGAILGTLKAGGKVTIPGFGTFSVGHRAARTGRNPRTGKEIRIPARKTAKFSAGKQMREVVG